MYTSKHRLLGTKGGFDSISISLRGYVGAGFVCDFANGITIGGGFPFGGIISIDIDWDKTFN